MPLDTVPQCASMLQIPVALEKFVYNRTDTVVVLHGDNQDILPVLNEGSIDIVVTSPPYNASIEKFKASGMMKEPAMQAWIDKMASGYQDTLPEEDYQQQQVDILAHLYRACRTGASVFYNHKIRWRDKSWISPLTWITKSSFNMRTEIVWDRGVGTMLNARMPYLQDERMYWLYKGDTWEWNQDAVGLGTVWRIPPQKYKEHACVFPDRLVGNCLRCVAKPGHVVLDPYAGSGTVGSVAQYFGCHAILIEREERYCQVIMERLQQQVLPMALSPTQQQTSIIT